MTGSLRLSLKPGERIYINGAVLKVDRKVTLHLLNDAVFLLEQHVMTADQTTTPLRQLYFVIQLLLIDPRARTTAEPLCREQLAELNRTVSSEALLAGLGEVARALDGGRPLEALKIIRRLLPIEAQVLGSEAQISAPPALAAAG
jgi:flagellar biosynthesis repressor protein FlbT